MTLNSSVRCSSRLDGCRRLTGCVGLKDLNLNISAVVGLLCWKVGQTTVVTMQMNCTISMFWPVMKTLFDVLRDGFVDSVTSNSVCYSVQVFHLLSDAADIVCFCALDIHSHFGFCQPVLLSFV